MKLLFTNKAPFPSTFVQENWKICDIPLLESCCYLIVLYGLELLSLAAHFVVSLYFVV